MFGKVDLLKFFPGCFLSFKEFQSEVLILFSMADLSLVKINHNKTH